MRHVSAPKAEHEAGHGRMVNLRERGVMDVMLRRQPDLRKLVGWSGKNDRRMFRGVPGAVVRGCHVPSVGSFTDGDDGRIQSDVAVKAALQRVDQHLEA